MDKEIGLRLSLKERKAAVAGLRDVRAEVDDTGDAAERAGVKADKSSGRWNRMGGALSKVAKIGAVAAGAVAAAGGALSKVWADQASAGAKLGASLGLSPDQAKRTGRIAGRIYADNFGATFEDVTLGLRSVLTNIDGMGDASDRALQRIASRALNTADVFDQDIGGVTRAVGQLMRTGLAKNAADALDIITVGFQRGADKAEDYLDTINEYGTQFRKLGLDGRQATGLITQGIAAGARDGDKVADALKEFSIRAVDGSEASSAAFRLMGLDAGAMTAQIAKGGKSATGGLVTVLDALRAMRDPVKREAAAVGIFGTQAEDLGKALYSLDPETAVDGLGRVGGAAKRASDMMSDTPQARWNRFTRSLQQGFVNVMGDEVIPLMGRLNDSVSGHDLKGGLGPKVQRTMDVVVPIVTSVVDGVRSKWGEIRPAITEVWTSAKIIITSALIIIESLWERFGSNIVSFLSGTLANTITVLRGAFNIVAGVFKTVAALLRGDWSGAWEGIKQILRGALQVVVGLVRQGWNTVRAITTSLWTAVRAVVSGAWGAIKSGVASAATYVGSKLSGLVRTITGMPDRVRTAAAGMFDGIKDAFRGALNFVIDGWNAIEFKIPEVDTHIPGVGKVGGGSFGTPNIPRLAEGGIVRAQPGGLLANIGEGRWDEAIVPLNGRRYLIDGTGVTPLDPPAGMSDSDIDAHVGAGTDDGEWWPTPGGPRPPIVVRIELDRKVVGEAVLDDLDDRVARK